VGLTVALLVLGLGGYFGWSYFVPKEVQEDEAFEYKVRRGTFVHKITERGEIQSAKNEEIACKVKGQTGQGVKILKLLVEEAPRSRPGKTWPFWILRRSRMSCRPSR
jgi:hypothetical protein